MIFFLVKKYVIFHFRFYIMDCCTTGGRKNVEHIDRERRGDEDIEPRVPEAESPLVAIGTWHSLSVLLSFRAFPSLRQALIVACMACDRRFSVWLYTNIILLHPTLLTTSKVSTNIPFLYRLLIFLVVRHKKYNISLSFYRNNWIKTLMFNFKNSFFFYKRRVFNYSIYFQI